MTEIERFALDYLPVILFLGLGVILSLLFIIGAAILAPSNPDPEKNSAYECRRSTRNCRPSSSFII